MLLLTACATNTPATKSTVEKCKDVIVTVDTSCKWVKPIYVSKKEAEMIRTGEISAETARQIYALNEQIVAICGDPKKPK